MKVLQERIDDLFKTVQIATTEEVAGALMINGHHNSIARSIKSRATRAGINLEHIGYNAWVIS